MALSLLLALIDAYRRVIRPQKEWVWGGGVVNLVVNPKLVFEKKNMKETNGGSSRQIIYIRLETDTLTDR